MAILAATYVAQACDDDERRLVGTGCAICAFVGWAGCEACQQSRRPEARRAEAMVDACGRCPPRQECNLLRDPPRCTVRFASEGEPCGDVSLPSAVYLCRWGRCETSTVVSHPCDFEHGLACGEGGTCVPEAR